MGVCIWESGIVQLKCFSHGLNLAITDTLYSKVVEHLEIDMDENLIFDEEKFETRYEAYPNFLDVLGMLTIYCRKFVRKTTINFSHSPLMCQQGGQVYSTCSRFSRKWYNQSSKLILNLRKHSPWSMII